MTNSRAGTQAIPAGTPLARAIRQMGIVVSRKQTSDTNRPVWSSGVPNRPTSRATSHW